MSGNGIFPLNEKETRMAFDRKSQAVWHGNLKEGSGKINASSGVLKDVSYTWATRFDNAPGTNPEELVASAHAACFSMFLANLLSKKEHKVHHIETSATVTLDGTTITKIVLNTTGKVEDIDQATFQTNAEEAKAGCPISKALASVPIELIATLA
jgi:lipoyl-dependent peroxiredoxin